MEETREGEEEEFVEKGEDDYASVRKDQDQGLGRGREGGRGRVSGRGKGDNERGGEMGEMGLVCDCVGLREGEREVTNPRKREEIAMEPAWREKRESLALVDL